MTARLLILVAVVGLLAPPALAHSLRVFVTAEGQIVRGYGFFVGGGRPAGAGWQAEAGDRTLATGTTDADGAFGFVLPGPVAADIVVTIDPGDGHRASATLPSGRLAAPAPTSPAIGTARAPLGAASRPPDGAGSATPGDVGGGDGVVSDGTAAGAAADTAGVGTIETAGHAPVQSRSETTRDAALEAAVDRAVARQMEPLLVRIENMDNRMRLTDLVSGGLAIFGLASIGLWWRGRAR